MDSSGYLARCRSTPGPCRTGCSRPGAPGHRKRRTGPAGVESGPAPASARSPAAASPPAPRTAGAGSSHPWRGSGPRPGWRPGHRWRSAPPARPGAAAATPRPQAWPRPTARPQTGWRAHRPQAWGCGLSKQLRQNAWGWRSVELLQVHAGIQRRHLGLVAIELEGLALLGKQAVLTDAALGGLAPARVVHLGVHIGIEAVLVGRRLVPGRARLLVGEADAHQALGALETVFPGHHQAHRGPVLLGQHF